MRSCNGEKLHLHQYGGNTATATAAIYFVHGLSFYYFIPHTISGLHDHGGRYKMLVDALSQVLMRMFLLFCQRIAQHFLVYGMDLLGHGQSEGERGIIVDFAVRDLFYFLLNSLLAVGGRWHRDLDWWTTRKASQVAVLCHVQSCRYVAAFFVSKNCVVFMRWHRQEWFLRRMRATNCWWEQVTTILNVTTLFFELHDDFNYSIRFFSFASVNNRPNTAQTNRWELYAFRQHWKKWKKLLVLFVCWFFGWNFFLFLSLLTV